MKIQEGTLLSNIIFGIVYTFLQELRVDDRSMCNTVSRNLLQKMNALPRHLFYPFIFLMLFFYYSPILFHLKTFLNMKDQQMIRYVNGWKTSKIGPKKDFIRFFQSLFLLIFYSLAQESLPNCLCLR